MVEHPQGNPQVPYLGFLLFVERFFGAIATPGGRLVLVLLLTLTFFAAMLIGQPKAAWFAGACLLAFLKLVKK